MRQLIIKPLILLYIFFRKLTNNRSFKIKPVLNQKSMAHAVVGHCRFWPISRLPSGCNQWNIWLYTFIEYQQKFITIMLQFWNKIKMIMIEVHECSLDWNYTVNFSGKTSPLDSHLTKMCKTWRNVIIYFWVKVLKKLAVQRNCKWIHVSFKTKKNAYINYAFRTKNGSLSY